MHVFCPQAKTIHYRGIARPINRSVKSTQKTLRLKNDNELAANQKNDNDGIVRPLCVGLCCFD